MVLLSPKTHHMAESDLDYQTAMSEVYHQDSSLIAVFELSFAWVGAGNSTCDKMASDS